MCYSSEMQPADFAETAFAPGAPPKPEFRLASRADVEETYKVYVIANEELNRQLGRHSDLEETHPANPGPRSSFKCPST